MDVKVRIVPSRRFLRSVRGRSVLRSIRNLLRQVSRTNRSPIGESRHTRSSRFSPRVFFAPVSRARNSYTRRRRLDRDRRWISVVISPRRSRDGNFIVRRWGNCRTPVEWDCTGTQILWSYRCEFALLRTVRGGTSRIVVRKRMCRCCWAELGMLLNFDGTGTATRSEMLEIDNYGSLN